VTLLLNLVERHEPAGCRQFTGADGREAVARGGDASDSTRAHRAGTSADEAASFAD
jgi:hypothetical protein